jgi:hypothetical protein
VKNKDALPRRARRALNQHVEMQNQVRLQSELKEKQLQARYAVRTLLLTNCLPSAHATALRLYSGVHDGRWRSLGEVGKMMQLTKERARQLLYPSKVILADMLDGKVPWKPISGPEEPRLSGLGWRSPMWIRCVKKRLSSRPHLEHDMTAAGSFLDVDDQLR